MKPDLSTVIMAILAGAALHEIIGLAMGPPWWPYVLLTGCVLFLILNAWRNK